MVFSGNANKRVQIGANLDYLYSKGSYQNQAAKGFTWGFNGSYIGDRYELQASWIHYNLLNKENGGITDPLYITDPAKLQGGYSTINPKSIPVNLNYAHTRMKGGELYISNKYNVGHWHEEYSEEDPDSVVSREYIPVTAFTWISTIATASTDSSTQAPQKQRTSSPTPTSTPLSPTTTPAIGK